MRSGREGSYEVIWKALKKGQTDKCLGAILRVRATEQWAVQELLVRVDAKGRSLLALAVEKKATEVVHMLLDCGACASDVSSMRGSALHAAVSIRDEELLDLLLSRGAVPWQADGCGYSAMDDAMDNCWQDALDRFRAQAPFAGMVEVKVTRMAGLSSTYKRCLIMLAPHLAGPAPSTTKPRPKPSPTEQQCALTQMCLFIRQESAKQGPVTKLWLGDVLVKRSTPRGSHVQLVLRPDHPIPAGGLCLRKSEDGRLTVKFRALDISPSAAAVLNQLADVILAEAAAAAAMPGTPGPSSEASGSASGGSGSTAGMGSDGPPSGAARPSRTAAMPGGSSGAASHSHASPHSPASPLHAARAASSFADAAAAAAAVLAGAAAAAGARSPARSRAGDAAAAAQNQGQGQAAQDAYWQQYQQRYEQQYMQHRQAQHMAQSQQPQLQPYHMPQQPGYATPHHQGGAGSGSPPPSHGSFASHKLQPPASFYPQAPYQAQQQQQQQLQQQECHREYQEQAAMATAANAKARKRWQVPGDSSAYDSSSQGDPNATLDHWMPPAAGNAGSGGGAAACSSAYAGHSGPRPAPASNLAAPGSVSGSMAGRQYSKAGSSGGGSCGKGASQGCAPSAPPMPLLTQLPTPQYPFEQQAQHQHQHHSQAQHQAQQPLQQQEAFDAPPAARWWLGEASNGCGASSSNGGSAAAARPSAVPPAFIPRDADGTVQLSAQAKGDKDKPVKAPGSLASVGGSTAANWPAMPGSAAAAAAQARSQGGSMPGSGPYPGAQCESGRCVICLVAPAQVGFLHHDTVHLAACWECAQGLVHRQGGGKGQAPAGPACCPLCREPIERVLAVY